jgi:hypothetical protein
MGFTLNVYEFKRLGDIFFAVWVVDEDAIIFFALFLVVTFNQINS